MLSPSTGFTTTSSSTPLLLVSPLNTFIELSVLIDPLALNSAVCAKLLFVIWYTFVKRNFPYLHL